MNRYRSDVELINQQQRNVDRVPRGGRFLANARNMNKSPGPAYGWQPIGIKIVAMGSQNPHRNATSCIVIGQRSHSLSQPMGFRHTVKSLDGGPRSGSPPWLCAEADSELPARTRPARRIRVVGVPVVADCLGARPGFQGFEMEFVLAPLVEPKLVFVEIHS